MNVGPVGYPIHMSRRLNNCKACGGCHTGRGGQFCPFVSPGGTKRDSPTDMAMLGPDRDIPEYESNLAEKIAEEEEHLKTFQDKCRVSIMEVKLARLRLQTKELGKKSMSDRHEGDSSPDCKSIIGCHLPGDRWCSRRYPGHRSIYTPQCPQEEKVTLSKLQALDHLPEQKAVEKITYRDQKS